MQNLQTIVTNEIETLELITNPVTQFIPASMTANTATAIVVPNRLETRDGNGRNGIPFSIDEFNLKSLRYQQIYDAGEFAVLSEAQLITQILFRPDRNEGNAFSSTLAHIQINLSTTNVAPDALSTTFADNIGSDETIVFNGTLLLSSANTRVAGRPKDFDIVISLDTPFLYDPSLGNLLLDVKNFSGGLTTRFDAEFRIGDSISRVTTSIGQDVNTPTGFADTLGLVTKFIFQPIVSVSPSASVSGLLILPGLELA